MYWILAVMALLVSALCAIVVGGLATPRKHSASRAITLQAAPDTVWRLLRTVIEYPRWRDEIQSIQSADSDDRATTWTEVGRQKVLSYAAVTDEPPLRFTVRVVEEGVESAGEWQYEVAPAGSGTRLTVTETGEVGNPILRFFAAHVRGYTGAIDAFLRDVAVELGERAAPQTPRA